MKLVRVPGSEALLSETESRFAAFNAKRAPSPGRRYPSDLMALLCQGIDEGIRCGDLSRITGVPRETIKRWLKKGLTTAQPAQRRLEVVQDVGIAKAQLPSPITIRHCSGLTTELADARGITPELLAALGWGRQA